MSISLSNLANSPISRAFQSFREQIENLTYTKVYAFSKTVFLLGQGWFMVAYGVKEVLIDGVQNKKRLENQQHTNHRIQSYLKGFYEAVRNVQWSSVAFSRLHGAFFMLTGITGGLAALHDFQLVNLGAMYGPVMGISQLAFIFANIVALDYNVRVYRQALSIEKEHPLPAQQKMAHHLKISAILGIISSLNYLVAATVSLFGGAFAIAMIFGCIAVCFGCFKILYDFLYVNVDQQLKQV